MREDRRKTQPNTAANGVGKTMAAQCLTTPEASPHAMCTEKPGMTHSKPYHNTDTGQTLTSVTGSNMALH